MAMGARDGVGVLFVLADQWARQRDLLSLLGAEKPGRLDDLIHPDPDADADTRDARIAAVLELGGEVIS